jgi:hypothetical protein
MDATTRRVVVDLRDGSKIRREDGSPYPFRGVRGFDYANFYRQALDCEVVRNSDQMRSAIANVLWIRYEKTSVPEMIKLLDDSNTHICRTAVSALRKCIHSDMSNSWEPRHFYDPDAAREYMNSSIEKKLEDRQNRANASKSLVPLIQHAQPVETNGAPPQSPGFGALRLTA